MQYFSQGICCYIVYIESISLEYFKSMQERKGIFQGKESIHNIILVKYLTRF